MSDDRTWFLGLHPVTWFILMCAAGFIIWMCMPYDDDDPYNDDDHDDLRGDEWRDK